MYNTDTAAFDKHYTIGRETVISSILPGSNQNIFYTKLQLFQPITLLFRLFLKAPNCRMN